MGVIIGMDPHKRSATIEVVDESGRRLAVGRFGMDRAGYVELLAAGREHPDRVWAVEGCNWIGRHIAHRLVHDGESVVDVPPKLSAHVRVLATGNGRKTDPVNAHSVALAAVYAPADPGLVQVVIDDDLVVMGMLVDRRDERGRARTQTVNRLHRLLLELFPGGAKQFLSAPQARSLIATTKPRDLVGKTRRRLAVELIVELRASTRRSRPSRRSSPGWSPTAAPRCWSSPASVRRERLGCSPTSGTFTGSGTGTGSRPGTAPHPGRVPSEPMSSLQRSGRRSMKILIICRQSWSSSRTTSTPFSVSQS